MNFVVNRRTLPDLDEAVGIAAEAGAAEVLLLPEMPVRGRRGIDAITRAALADWIEMYRGSVPLTVGQGGAEGLTTCDPMSQENGLRGYAHIDAEGVLKRSSYDADGVAVGEGSLMEALDSLEMAR